MPVNASERRGITSPFELPTLRGATIDRTQGAQNAGAVFVPYLRVCIVRLSDEIENGGGVTVT